MKKENERHLREWKKRLLAFLMAFILCFGMAGVLPLTDETAVETVYAASTLGAPTASIQTSGYEGLKISWKKVKGAGSYVLFRSASKNTGFKRIATVKKLTYVDSKIEQNKTYYYKVRAKKGGKTGPWSGIVSGSVNTALDLSGIPAWNGDPYVAVRGNKPSFSSWMYTQARKSYETYSPLDSAGRCGPAVASVGRDLMPTEERGPIGSVKPTGWHTVKYDNIDGKYLYNRCHLIGYQLSGENANNRNLITGTRYMNVEGMLPFENMVADYVKESGNHVLYRSTPVFQGSELLARGVELEAASVEDNGAAISFHVFVYNVQPGITINYSNGDSSLTNGGENPQNTPKPENTPKPQPQNTPKPEPTVLPPQGEGQTYVLNTNTKKFHYPSCSSVKQMSESNKQIFTGSREQVIQMGYDPCKRCNP